MPTKSHQPAPSRTIRRITSREDQDTETYRYWQSRTTAERMAAIDELIKDAYAARGIDLDAQGSNRSIVRVQRTWR